MEIKDAITTGAMVLVGIIVLKAFGGVKGITSMIGGIGELFDVGTAPPAAGGGGLGAIFAPTEVPMLEEGEVIPDPEVATIPSFFDLTTLATVPPTPQYIPLPTSEDRPPSPLDLLNPFKGVEPMPDPTPIIRYTPTVPVTYQPDPVMIPSDPGHPATDPFLGGR